MEFNNWLESQEMTWAEEIENTSGYRNIVAILKKHSAMNVFIPKLKTKVLVFTLDNQIYVIDDFESPNPEQAERWVSDQIWDSRKIAQYLNTPDFNEEFWRNPPPVLYHGTTEEFWDEIQKAGEIKVKNKTRGLSNRFVPPSIFTSIDLEICQHYYKVCLAINIRQMKVDGYMPNTEQEPDVEKCSLESSLAWAIGLEDYEAECESGMDEGTVIFYQNIPLKYVQRVV
jgi:hypothetical protein